MNLGELADLTVANDNDLSMDVISPPLSRGITRGGVCVQRRADRLGVLSPRQMQDNREEFKKTWNPRFTLRSHFDAIRALTFHPGQAVLLTASEDGTLKLWNLNKAMHSKK